MKNLFDNADNYKHLINEKKYDKNNIIFFEGDICKYVCIIKKGEVSIKTINYDKEIEINLLHKDELFGDSLILSNDPRYLGNVVALTDSTIYLIEKLIRCVICL